MTIILTFMVILNWKIVQLGSRELNRGFEFLLYIIWTLECGYFLMRQSTICRKCSIWWFTLKQECYPSCLVWKTIQKFVEIKILKFLSFKINRKYGSTDCRLQSFVYWTKPVEHGLRVVQTETILFLKSMSERVGSDTERLWIWMMNF